MVCRLRIGWRIVPEIWCTRFECSLCQVELKIEEVDNRNWPWTLRTSDDSLASLLIVEIFFR